MTKSDDEKEDENPYAATAIGSGVEMGIDMSDVAQVRRMHIGHEASIRSIGLLYYVGAAICLAVALPILLASRTRSDLTAIGFVLPVGTVLVVLGFGLRGLRPWVRPYTILLSVVGLLGFPVGTMISAYVLYLMLSSKGRLVLSPQYEDIVARTSFITYRTSIIVWIALGLLLVVLTMGTLAVMLVG